MQLAKKIKEIESEPTGYAALRFVIDAINIVGWLVSISHTFVVFFAIYPFIDKRFPGEPLPAIMLTLLAWMGGIFVGIIIIASAQVLEILMDIRRDLHITRRYIRAFGLDNVQE
jgi:hypothetical protein